MQKVSKSFIILARNNQKLQKDENLQLKCILSTIYLETRNNFNAKKIYNILKKYHRNNYFVKIAKYNRPIGTGDIMNTNYCKISICEDRIKKKVIIISAIDNLIKGGSGQAVQNMNVAFNIKETMGLK